MDLRLVRYFLAVAEELHVGRAAAKLHMTQQPLSAAVQRLERSIGVELFVREANRLRLSAAGAALVPAARELLAGAEAAAETARAAARGAVGTLRIGYCSAAMHATIPALIKLHRSRCPGVAFDLVHLPQREQLERLTRGELDVAFVHRPIDERGRGVLPIGRDRLVVAMPSDHPLTAKVGVTASDVASSIGASFHPDEHAEFLAVVDEALGDHAASARPEAFGRDRTSVVGLVAGGAGMAIVTESGASAERRSDVAFRPLATPRVLEYVAVWNLRSGDDPLVRRLRATLGEVAARTASFVSAP